MMAPMISRTVSNGGAIDNCTQRPLGTILHMVEKTVGHQYEVQMKFAGLQGKSQEVTSK